MDKKHWWLLMLPVVLLSQVAIASAQPTIERQQELKNLLLQDCGSCHGMTLKGGLGPALTTDVMALRPRELLYATISEGREGTPMPPWKNMLSNDDINWLIDTLYQGINNAN